MKHYIVNLSSFSDEKAMELHQKLVANSYEVFSIANQPKMYEVIWESSCGTIQELCLIPSQFIKYMN